MHQTASNCITVLTYGTFDLFHVGHLRLLERARALGNRLIVSVVSDELCRVKGKPTIATEEDRASIIRALSVVDEVFIQRMLDLDEKKRDIERYSANFLVVGDDWKDHPRFEYLRGHNGVEIVYFPRTVGISSTKIKDRVLLTKDFGNEARIANIS